MKRKFSEIDDDIIDNSMEEMTYNNLQAFLLKWLHEKNIKVLDN